MRVTSQGQVAIPIEIRKWFDSGPGCETSHASRICTS